MGGAGGEIEVGRERERKGRRCRGEASV